MNYNTTGFIILINKKSMNYMGKVKQTNNLQIKDQQKPNFF